MTAKQIAAVIRQLPELTPHGIGLYDNGRGLSSQRKEQELRTAQAELLTMTAECGAICRWLSDKSQIKRINKQHSSYSLKHMAEKELGYISNGAFICAAVFCGFKYQIAGPNAYFNISEKSLRAARAD